ncbi:class II fumarate hydratase [Acanthopleuribacter pedis]|uniref:Fumarate hydratase class II n=1 Tax=Acanthopleuribacter pedis TaxID=442870 RepID=A0A8J7QAR1_9BACT|nr:class II fumarate hydratase [Acanthopleuribacter pedis]MBO1320982.1 class II fumarate hydratase [Acanthopleuribacter pedis]
MSETRIEKDSMGEVEVPRDALYGAQTQRAHNNFPISGIRFNRDFIKALGLIKQTAAVVNAELGCLDGEVADYISKAAQEVIDGTHDSHFVIDIFQTGSGTSTNMNANEIIAHRATELAKSDGKDVDVHPNDHVNYGQSSNDVIPTAIRVSAVLAIHETLMPGLKRLEEAFRSKGEALAGVVKTGRTHLMDAMPITFAQQFGGYASMVRAGRKRVESTMVRLSELPQGGTAVGTGINTHTEFGFKFAARMSEVTGYSFIEAPDHFEAQSTVDAPAETSAQLKTYACSLLKIANDLRWMNSGPYNGLGEIQLQPIQPGSSIMPGKVNPVIEESTAMVCAQVIGNDATITVAAQSGNFELNVMLPVVAFNLLQSIEILGKVSGNLAERSVEVLTVNEEHIKSLVEKNPILVTALNPVIGYDLGAAIAKKAFKERRALKDVAKEMTDLSDADLESYLDPMKMTRGGFIS